ncbi:hypothetical protein [Helcococcus ovis]
MARTVFIKYFKGYFKLSRARLGTYQPKLARLVVIYLKDGKSEDD